MEKDLYSQMLNTAANCGINVISKEHAAQLMSVVFLYGDENTVYSKKMNTDIMFISKQYGLYDGGIPDKNFVNMVSRYVSDIRNGNHLGWLEELEERYCVTFPKWSDDGIRISESVNGETGRR